MCALCNLKCSRGIDLEAFDSLRVSGVSTTKVSLICSSNPDMKRPLTS